MKAILLGLAVIIQICSLGSAQTEADWIREFQGLENSEVAPFIAKKLAGATEIQVETLSRQMVNIAHDNVGKNTSNSLILQTAIALMEIGDERAIIDAFASNLQNMNGQDQADAVYALCTCHSEEAYKPVETVTRGYMALIPEDAPVNASDEEKRAIEDRLQPFARLLLELAQSKSPIGKRIATKIRAEMAQKAQQHDLWELLCKGIDEEIQKRMNYDASPTRAPRRNHDRPNHERPQPGPSSVQPSSSEKSPCATEDLTGTPVPWVAVGMGVGILLLGGGLWCWVRMRK